MFESVLGLRRSDLQRSWNSLEAVGNLSSASVLHILADTIELDRPAPGERGAVLALGPGVSAEIVLLEW